MKVGDWVRYKSFNYISIVTKIYDDKKGYYSKFSVEVRDWNRKNTKTATPEQLELWQPKEGEWCWSKYDGLVQILKITDERYIVFPLSTSEKDCTIEYRLGGLEPFIGELPSFIKDKHGSNN